MKKLDRLCGKIHQAIQRDGDAYRNSTGWLHALINDIIEAAREEGRREARPSKKVLCGLLLLRGPVRATSPEMFIGRENDSKLNADEKRACAQIEAACEWIEAL